MVIERKEALREIGRRLSTHPVVVLRGPKYCGKTVLARRFADSEAETETEVAFFDLFRPEDERLLRTPTRAWLPHTGLVVVDEAQRLSGFTESLRILIERRSPEARTLLLGRGPAALAQGASEVVGDRLGFVDLAGFDLEEIFGRPGGWRRLWERGGYPTSYLARSAEFSHSWRRGFVEGIRSGNALSGEEHLPAGASREFWRVLVRRHGDTWRPAPFARAVRGGEREALRHLDRLEGEGLVSVLPAWHAHVEKRQVLSPKVYVRDSGLLHALIGSSPLGSSSTGRIPDPPGVERSFAGFVIEQVRRRMGQRVYHHWRAEGGVGVALLFWHRRRAFGVETRYGVAPKSTWRLRAAVRDLHLERLFVVHPGTERYELDDRIEALPVADLPTALPSRHAPSF